MLDIKDAIRIEEYMPPSRINTGRKPNKIYIFKCKTRECNGTCRVKESKRLMTATGFCITCNNRNMHSRALDAVRLAPFQALLNRLHDSAKKRNILVSLTLKEFIEFTTQDKCHYCLTPIKWQQHGSGVYNLDRKSNDLGYHKDNCVVCCYKCNKGKRELYTYNEWFGMTEYFRHQCTNGVCGL